MALEPTLLWRAAYRKLATVQQLGMAMQMCDRMEEGSKGATGRRSCPQGGGPAEVHAVHEAFVPGACLQLLISMLEAMTAVGAESPKLEYNDAIGEDGAGDSGVVDVTVSD